MQQRTDGRSDVRNVYFAGVTAMRHLPSIEQQWYMCVVWIPLAMCCSDERRPWADLIESWFDDHDDVARAMEVIAQQDAVAQHGGDRCSGFGEGIQ